MGGLAVNTLGEVVNGSNAVIPGNQTLAMTLFAFLRRRRNAFTRQYPRHHNGALGQQNDPTKNARTKSDPKESSLGPLFPLL
eukprot:1932062-Pyramimonas_sp.AAC.1